MVQIQPLTCEKLYETSKDLLAVITKWGRL